MHISDFLSRHPDDEDSPNEIIPIAFMLQELGKSKFPDHLLYLKEVDPLPEQGNYIPHINHDLALALSNILVYRGSCQFNLLCRNTLLKTIGRRLLQYKTVQDLPKVTIKLYRVDLWNNVAKSLLSKNSSKMDTSNGDTTDTDITEIYEYCNMKQQTPEPKMKHKNGDNNNNKVIQENTNDFQQEYTDSDSTKLYEHEEKEIGIIYFLQKKTKNRDHHKHQFLPHLLYFKCPHANCKFKSNKWKVTNKHYRLKHKK